MPGVSASKLRAPGSVRKTHSVDATPTLSDMRSERPYEIRIVCRAAPETLDRHVQGLREWSWIYFGSEVQQFCKIRRAVRERGRPLNSGRLINDVAREIGQEFINFDRNLDVGQHEILWHCTDMAERNPYSSDLFYRCCAILVFNRVLKDLMSDLVVFAEDSFLGALMVRQARAQGFTAKRSGGSATAVHVRQFVGAFSCRIKFIRNFLRRRQHLNQRGRRPLGNIDAILVTWADGTTFRADQGNNRNVYFGDLPVYLHAHGKRVGYLANPALWVAPYEAIAANCERAGCPVVLPEQTLTVADALWIAWKTLAHSVRLKSPFVLQGVDLGPLVTDEIRRERAKSRQCWACQYYFIGRYLRERGVRPAVVIHPCENQSWEKALRIGLKEHLPDTRVVGYQHTPFSSLWLAHFPSARDLQCSHMPDSIVTIGQRWKNLLRGHGYPADRLTVGPALRFSHVVENQHSKSAPSRTILVAASIGYHDSFELVYKTIEALRDMAGIDVLVKFHPKMAGDPAELISSVLDTLDLGALPAHFQVTKKPITELLPSIGLLVYNTTSVVYEALAYGVPALFVQSDIWFDIDPLPPNSNLAMTARERVDIRRVVEHLLGLKASAVRPHWRLGGLADLLCPVTQESLKTFLELFGQPTEKV